MTTTMSALLVSLKDNGDHDNDNDDHDNDNCENMMMVKIYTEMRIN